MSAPAPRRRRRAPRRQELGLSLEQYEQLLEVQGGRCAMCPTKPADAWSPVARWRCRYCKATNQPNSEQPHAAGAGYSECAECGRARPKPRRLDVDHDHETGEVRGLLCHRCNRGLGLLGTVELLTAGLGYLADYRERRARAG